MSLTITRKVTVSGGTVLRAANNLGDVANAETSWNNLAGGNRTITGNLTVSGTGTSSVAGNFHVDGGSKRLRVRDTAILDSNYDTLTVSAQAQKVFGIGVGAVSGTPAQITINGETNAVAIQGTTTNDNAATGYVGEYVESVITSASYVELTTATAANVTSISLSAGDWNVFGNVAFLGIGNPTASLFAGGVHTSSAVLPADSNRAQVAGPSNAATTILTVPTVRISVSGTTTVYLVAYTEYSGGTNVRAWGRFSARRVR